LKNGISTSMDILLKFSRQLESKSLTFRDQNITGDEFKCRKRYPSDGEILPTMTEDQVYNLIRALVSPWPGAFYCDKECKKIIIDNKISIKDASSILEKIRSK
jgi:methionyl-tRNA formyltransferase